MVKTTHNDVIKQEIDAILSDILALYNASGKRTSGNFEKQLKATYTESKAEIFGVQYLAGRGKTKNGNKGDPYLVESILEWIKMKGIQPKEAKMSISSLAWAIATKIHREGTNKDRHLKVYEQIITPERIDSIIKKVSVFNVDFFTRELETQFNLLAKNI